VQEVQGLVKVSRRRVRRRPRQGPNDVEAAHRMLENLGRALEVAILVQEVDGDGPVRIRAMVMHGSDGVEVEVVGATETDALMEVGRRALRIRGADEAWIRRYGLGMG
jgi:hypothetical protein